MKLGPDSLRWALGSLKRMGDTDLFPRPVEFDAMFVDIDTTITVMADIDLGSHEPGPARRFIVPKDDLSYRQATQLDPLDSVLASALTYELGRQVEERRRRIEEHSVFSYRFQPSDEGDFFAGGNAWNEFWAHCRTRAHSYPYVLTVDIADFYNQIYHHVVENQLAESGWPNSAIKLILRLLNATTAQVSRGIPVGPHWTHLLGEASLIPLDNSMTSRGLRFARFVDDIVVFVQSDEEARVAILSIAEILDRQQRLHLQNSKTRILRSEDFRTLAGQMIQDRPINDLERLI